MRGEESLELSRRNTKRKMTF